MDKSKYTGEHLTPNETRLMEYLWEFDAPTTSADLLKYIKDWKNGYIQNVLMSLTKKGMIECVNIVQNGRRFLKQYKVTITKEEYAARMINQLHIKKKSIPRIALALVEDLPEDDRDEIISELEQIVDEFKNRKCGGL